MSSSIYQFSARLNDGRETSLADYSGKILLIVNTASKCGFTSQYQGLEELYNDYREKGFEILAFPCDQFGHQEPGSDADIREFCDLNYSVSFPLFHKIEVNGDNAHPLFAHLKEQAKGILGTKRIKWNFTKFLVNREGQVVERYSPTTKPQEIRSDIIELL